METSASESYNLKVVGYVPQERFLRKNVTIGLIEGVCSNLSESVMLSLRSLGYTGPVDSESLARAVETVFKLRLMQVSKMKPVAGFRPTDYKVWSFLYPLLCQVGIYRNEAAGYELYPTYEGQPVSVEDVEHLNKVVSSLSYWGLSYSMGLPKDTTIESDELYKLAIQAEEVLGSKEVPTPVALMSRLFFEVAALSEIYGEPRIAYSTIRYLQQVFVDVVQGRLKNPSSVKT